MVTVEPEFCPVCGTALESVRREGRHRKRCPVCDRVVYRSPAIGADTAVVRDGAVLCVRRGQPPEVGAWTVPGGYLEADEDPAAGAARELAEETTLRVEPEALTLLAATNREWGGRRLVSLCYGVRWSRVDGTARPGSDATAVEWFDADDLRADASTFVSHGREWALTALAEL